MTGKLIVFEGVDGSGKSTASKYLFESFKARGFDCIHTREIGGTKIAETLRNLAFNVNSSETIDPNARLLMLYAARIQHIKNVIEPAINAGKIVICDRYIYSSYVYQGMVDGLLDSIKNLENNSATSFLAKKPDFLFYLKVSPEVSVQRNIRRQNGIDTQYKKDIDFAIKLISGYEIVTREYSLQNKDKLLEINGELSIENINKILDNFVINDYPKLID